METIKEMNELKEDLYKQISDDHEEKGAIKELAKACSAFADSKKSLQREKDSLKNKLDSIRKYLE